MVDVSITKVTEQSKEGVRKAVETAMNLANWRNFITQGADISLKVNLCWDYQYPGAQTSPWVLDAVIQHIQDYVGKINVVEADCATASVENAIKTTKLWDVCQKYGVNWVNVSKSPYKEIELENGLGLKKVLAPEIFYKTEVITLPVLKTHGLTTITGAIKNQWGCLPTLRHNYHLFVDKALTDINRVVNVKFCVMDGTVGMEGDGPKSGISRVTDLILASPDRVALDTIAAELIGFSSNNIDHIKIAASHGLGINDLNKINVLGESIDKVRMHFVPAKKNTVSKLEFLFRHSTLSNLVFNTPLFELVKLGVKCWYAWWIFREGDRLKKNIIKNSNYGAQWR